MPVLTIIAGPNGAGKSTHSNDFIKEPGIESFDFDKEFYSIWSQFGFDPYIEQGAFDRAQNLYIERRTIALQQNQDFAFETNYHTREILSVIHLFKSNGYKIELIFICLENTNIAFERVKDRVAKGGHSVDEETIQERFKSGLTLLDESFQLYDMVSIYLSEWRKVEPVLILEPQQNKLTLFNSIPYSIAPRLPQIMELVLKNTTA